MRRFGKRTFSPQQLVEIGSLTPELLDVARETLAGRGNILVSGRTGSGKTTLLNALIELLPPDERIVSIKDTLELRIDHANSVRSSFRDWGKIAYLPLSNMTRINSGRQQAPAQLTTLMSTGLRSSRVG